MPGMPGALLYIHSHKRASVVRKLMVRVAAALALAVSLLLLLLLLVVVLDDPSVSGSPTRVRQPNNTRLRCALHAPRIGRCVRSGVARTAVLPPPGLRAIPHMRMLCGQTSGPSLAHGSKLASGSASSSSSESSASSLPGSDLFLLLYSSSASGPRRMPSSPSSSASAVRSPSRPAWPRGVWRVMRVWMVLSHCGGEVGWWWLDSTHW